MKRLLFCVLALSMALALATCGGRNVGIIGGADGPTEILVSAP